eukprot:GHVS01089583.1.p1 GENE.GHVS01089583.1~~GHVS01089583.1.p1  ORF type:complete len:236 (-),score=21.78 GHVS01089583.1:423-1130(-)
MQQQQQGYPVKVGIATGALLSLLVVWLSLCSCRAAAPLRHLGIESEEFLADFLKLKIRFLELDDEKELWADMDPEEVSNLVRGAHVYGFSNDRPRVIERSWNRSILEVTLGVGDTNLQDKIDKGSTNKKAAEEIEVRIRLVEEDIMNLRRGLSNLKSLLKEANAVSAEEPTRVVPVSELANGVHVSAMREMGAAMTFRKVEEVGDVTSKLASVFSANAEFTLGYCYGIPMMAFRT